MSIIGPTSIVIGDVSGRGDLEIVGRVQGDVTVEGTVTVAPEGVVLGSIRAQEVRVAGRVDGTVAAKDSLSLQAGANVSGDLVAARLGIEEGARVRGSVRTEGAEHDEVDELEDEDVVAPNSASAEVPSDAPGQERRRRDRRRRRSHSGSGGAPTPTLPLAPRPAAGPTPKHLPPSSAVPSSTAPAEPASPRLPQPGGAGRPSPPAPVVPALAKGVRGRRRPSSGQD